MKKQPFLLIGIIVIIVFGLGIWRYVVVAKGLSTANNELAVNNQKITELEQTVASLNEQNSSLQENLLEEEERNDDFEKQIKKLSGTVSTLQKLSETDKELLQKYSKVYFLNEHYVPKKLESIAKKYVFNNAQKDIKIHSEVEPFLTDLIEDAKDDDMNLLVLSGYRSFAEQSALKTGYTVTYGSGANQFSAEQGFSEHQLGTTVDFTTPTLGVNFENIESTPEFEWLVDNAYRYGFVLSYPKNNTYYQYEPWHWRFVGTDLARDLKRKGKYFYDLDQRDIDEYLVEIFD